MTSDGANILDWIRYESNLKTKVYYIRGDVNDEDHLRRAGLFPETPNCNVRATIMTTTAAAVAMTLLLQRLLATTLQLHLLWIFVLLLLVILVET